MSRNQQLRMMNTACAQAAEAAAKQLTATPACDDAEVEAAQAGLPAFDPFANGETVMERVAKEREKFMADMGRRCNGYPANSTCALNMQQAPEQASSANNIHERAMQLKLGPFVQGPAQVELLKSIQEKVPSDQQLAAAQEFANAYRQLNLVRLWSSQIDQARSRDVSWADPQNQGRQNLQANVSEARQAIENLKVKWGLATVE